jgi:hypothetical protein
VVSLSLFLYICGYSSSVHHVILYRTSSVYSYRIIFVEVIIMGLLGGEGIHCIYCTTVCLLVPNKRSGGDEKEREREEDWRKRWLLLHPAIYRQTTEASPHTAISSRINT